MKKSYINIKYLITIVAAFALLPFQGDAETGLAPKLRSVKALLETYRQASARVQSAAADQRIPYCVFKEADPVKKDKMRVAWQTIDGVRRFVSRSSYIDRIVADAQGAMSKREDVPVKGAMFNLFNGLIPLDTDTYRVLRQTREYDRQNFEKFQIFAGGFDKVAPQAALGRASEQLRRLSGTFGFGGLDQLLAYVQRDFSREFNDKRLLNFGKCEGAAELVLEIDVALREERSAVSQLVSSLEELARGG